MSRRQKLYSSGIHLPLVALTAASSRTGYWIALAIVYVLLFVGIRLWARLERAHAERHLDGATPNPFGH